ncbi:hypothetical protein ABIB68_000010 [Bradyrhizobium sp. F1.2.2]
MLQGLLSGQYVHPVRIVCFNAIEGWSRDATSDVADGLARRAVDTDDDKSAALQAFIAHQCHQTLRRPARAAAEGRRVMFKEGQPRASAAQLRVD